MSENSTELPVQKTVIKTSKLHQERVDEKLTAMEEENPSTNFDKTKLELISANKLARDIVAQELMQERHKKKAFALAEKMQETSRNLGDAEEALTRDKLTGLRNRGWFDNELQKKIEEANAQDSTTSLWAIFIDLDKFKDINTIYGHVVGDEIIKLMGKTVREGEELARYGGEEFIQLVDLSRVRGNDTDISDEAKLASITSRYSSLFKPSSSSILKAYEPKGGADIPTPKQVSLSFGITRYQLGETPDAFINRASQAVTFAKNNGRDRAVISLPAEGGEQSYVALPQAA